MYCLSALNSLFSPLPVGTVLGIVSTESCKTMGLQFLVLVFSSFSYAVAARGWLLCQLTASLLVVQETHWWSGDPVVHTILVSFVGIPVPGNLLSGFAGKPVVSFLAHFTGTLVGRFPATFFWHPSRQCFLCASLDLWYFIELLHHPVGNSLILSS